MSDSEPCPGRASARRGEGDCSWPGPLAPTQLELGRWRERVPGSYAAWARNPVERLGVRPAGLLGFMMSRGPSDARKEGYDNLQETDKELKI